MLTKIRFEFVFDTIYLRVSSNSENAYTRLTFVNAKTVELLYWTSH